MPRIIDAIAARRRPDGMSAAQAAVYDFASELQRAGRVSDATFARAPSISTAAPDRSGGPLRLLRLIAMVLNVAEVPVPDGKPELAD